MAIKSKNLVAKLKSLDGITNKMLNRAVGVAGLALLSDAQNKTPTPPIKTGHLRGSQYVLVDEKNIAGGMPKDRPPKLDAGLFGAHVGFDTPYASYVHDHMTPAKPEKGRTIYPSELSERAGAGGLFLLNKMVENADRYKSKITESIKKSLREELK